MEPEVHIIERFFQEVMECFTMTNIRCKGGKEIDLLAICPTRDEKIHVEARVSTTFKLRSEATYTKKGSCHKNGVDYFAKEKFYHPVIVKRIHTLFGDKDYSKVLVVWDVEDESVIAKAHSSRYNIEIWLIGEILEELIHVFTLKRKKGFRDDVLRTLELVALYERTRLETKVTKITGKSILQKRLASAGW